MRKYDLTINSNGRINAMTRGFFEHVNSLSLAPLPEFTEKGKYRIETKEYQQHKEKFDKWIEKAQ